MKKTFLAILAGMIMLSSPVLAQTNKRLEMLGTFGSWTAYKMDEKDGKFMLVKISDSVKNALADAFLDTLIPTFTSVDAAVSKIEQ